MTKFKISNCDEDKKTQIVMNLRNLNWDETQKCDSKKISKALNVMKLKKSNCDETQQLKLRQNLNCDKTKIVTNLKNLKCDNQKT